MKKILTAIAALSLSFSAFAEGDNVAMPFLRIDQNTASAAQASISLFDNAASAIWTPGRGSVSVGYQRWNLNATNNFSVDASGKFKGLVAIRGRYLQQLENPYDIIDENGENVGSFTPQSLKAGLGVSGAIGKHIALGLDLSYARRALSAESAMNAFSFDPSVMVNFSGFQATVGTKNLGIPVKSSLGDKFPIPGSVFVAAGYDACIKDVHHIFPAAEFEYLFNGQMSFAGSLCYNWKDTIQLMGGYRYGGIIPSHASAGVGFCIKGLCINATMLFGAGDINTTALVSLGYRF